MHYLDDVPSDIVTDMKSRERILGYVHELRQRKPALFKGGSLIMPVHWAFHDNVEGGPTLTLSLDDRSHGASEHGTVTHLHMLRLRSKLE